MGGTVKEWESAALRDGFESACGEAFGSPCFVTGVRAASVIVDFKLVQYTDVATGAPILDRLSDPAVLEAFGKAVVAATGLPVESKPLANAVSGVGGDGSVLYRNEFPRGAIIGICVGGGIFLLLLGGGVYAYRRRRQAKAAALRPPTISVERV